MGARRRALAHASTLALVAGLAALVPVAGPAAPSAADPGCTSEVRPAWSLGQPLPASCDDSTPPDTVLTSVAPAPNAAGWTNDGTMTVAFAASAGDGDAGPWAFECRLVGPAQAHDWRACTSPVGYTGLVDTAAGQDGYRLEVRAVDAGDRPLTPRDGLGIPQADTPDLDPTPAAVAWRQDTRAPREFLTVDAYDELTPDRPVLRSRRLVARFNASEPGATFRCRDGRRPVACAEGRTVLTALASGPHALSLQVVDAAGNASGWSEPVRFTVPDDLRRAQGWKRKRSRSALDGDVVTTRRRGARLVLPRARVRELRLYADSAPRAGKVRVRVGRRAWQTVDLSGPRARGKEFTVFGAWEGTRRGRVQVEVVSRGRPVRLDAVLVR